MTSEIQQMQRKLQQLTEAGATESAERLAQFNEALGAISGALADLVTAVESANDKPEHEDSTQSAKMVVDAIKRISIPAPSVHVAAPTVNVQAPDVKVVQAPPAAVTVMPAPVTVMPAKQAKSVRVQFEYQGDRIIGAEIIRG